MKPKKAKLTEELIAKYKPEAIGHAKEVLEHVYQAMLGVPEFTLADGTKGRVERYYEPEVDEEGELTCGVDVCLDNGVALEFTVSNTGWGKSFVADHAAKKGQKGRRR